MVVGANSCSIRFNMGHHCEVSKKGQSNKTEIAGNSGEIAGRFPYSYKRDKLSVQDGKKENKNEEDYNRSIWGRIRMSIGKSDPLIL